MAKDNKAIKKNMNFKLDEMFLVLVVALLAMIASIYDKNSERIDAEKITAMILDDHYLSFATNGIVDENKLRQIQSMEYAEFKKSLNAKNDFCVYLEDENGNIILAKGSSRLSMDGLVCKE